MASETTSSELREMAQHRGLKLVTSRRRKPGVGDYGKYGLLDGKGEPLLGITEQGLTASAVDIENYLRAGTASTWKQSAKAVPDRQPAAPLGSRAERPENQTDSVRSEPSAPTRRATEAGRSRKERIVQQQPGRRERAGNVKPPFVAKPESQTDGEPRVQLSLVIRAAKPRDAGALARLLKQLHNADVTQPSLARDLTALLKAGGGAHVAEVGEVVGCSAWVTVPTLQRGRLGRVTALIVDEGHRRQGIGNRLLAAAEEALAKKGCTLIEVMSDIEIKNSHNFFRKLKFDQASYRFTRKAGIERS